MAFETLETQVYMMYVGYFGRPPAPTGLEYFVDILDDNENGLAVLFDDFWEADETQENYAGLSLAESVDQVFNQLFGRNAEPEGRDFWVSELEAGNTSLPALAADVAFSAEADGGADADVLNAKIATSMLWTNALDTQAELDAFDTEAGRETARDLLSTIVTDQPATQDQVDDAIASMPVDPPQPGETETLTLTQQADDLQGADGVRTVFEAPVTQNETGSGRLANTFETGDVLDGGADSLNELRADLIATGTISDAFGQGAAISATTDNIQNVNLRAQTPQQDAADNTTAMATVDAERMDGVQEWWSDNSRSNIRIEDIRTRPIDTDFGMSETDPAVSYEAFFNPIYMQGEAGAALLTLQIGEVRNGEIDVDEELTNIDVSALRFGFNDGEGEVAPVELNFEEYSSGEQRITKWDDSPEEEDAPSLLEAIKAELDKLAEEGGPVIDVVYDGRGNYLLSTKDGTFVADGGFTAEANTTEGQIDVRNVIRVGADEAESTETDLILDGAGNGSQGGDVNLAAMSGDRGIEIINVTVDNNSHITSLFSVNSPNTVGTRPFDSENQLEEVFVDHRANGAQGNLQIGTRTEDSQGASTTIDDRLRNDGLTDVRVFDAGGFGSEIKLGAQLTEQVFNKYLDPAEGSVQFDYLLGDGGNNLSLDIDDEVSRDVDFALDIVGGAMDDRINLTGMIEKSTIDIDGGEGVNTVSVDNTTADNVVENSNFGEFVNISRLVVEGATATTQNVVTGNMLGLGEIVVATDATDATTGGLVNTTLEQMEADTGIIVNGKNQTLGTGNSNNDQSFGAIEINGSPELDQVVDLYNTARFDGQLVVDNLRIDPNDDPADPESNVNTVTVNSLARLDREQSNAVTNLVAPSARNVELIGDKDLGVNVITLGNNRGGQSISVDGSELEADLTLGFEAALNRQGNDDSLIGTDGENDTLALHGDIDEAFNASISGFEHVQFGYNVNDDIDYDVASDLGDTREPGLGISGTYDAGNDSGVGAYQIALIDGDMTLDNLGSNINVVLGEADPDGNHPGEEDLGGHNLTLNGSEDQTELNIEMLEELDFDNDNGGYNIEINEYGTINIDVGHQVRPNAPSDRDERLDQNRDDRLDLNLNLDPVARDDDDDEIPTRAQVLNIDAQVGVELITDRDDEGEDDITGGAQFVDGLNITTGSGDDIIDMTSAENLTVDAKGGADRFIYRDYSDSPTGDRDTINGFQTSGDEADIIDIEDVLTTYGFTSFAFLDSVTGTDGDVNRKFAQLSTGFDKDVLLALYDIDRGELFFDTNNNGAIAGVDGEDLSIKMPNVTGISKDNFDTGDSGKGQAFTLRALEELDLDDLDIPVYRVLADSAEKLLESPEATTKALEKTSNGPAGGPGPLVITDNPISDAEKQAVEDEFGAGNVLFQADAQPVDPEELPQITDIAVEPQEVEEGESVTFTIETRNVDEGGELTLEWNSEDGFDDTDVVGGLPPTATVNADGIATVALDILADGTEEGTETFALTASVGRDSQTSGLVTVNDVIGPVVEPTILTGDWDENANYIFADPASPIDANAFRGDEGTDPVHFEVNVEPNDDGGMNSVVATIENFTVGDTLDVTNLLAGEVDLEIDDLFSTYTPSSEELTIGLNQQGPTTIFTLEDIDANTLELLGLSQDNLAEDLENANWLSGV